MSNEALQVPSVIERIDQFLNLTREFEKNLRRTAALCRHCEILSGVEDVGPYLKMLGSSMASLILPSARVRDRPQIKRWLAELSTLSADRRRLKESVLELIKVLENAIKQAGRGRAAGRPLRKLRAVMKDQRRASEIYDAGESARARAESFRRYLRKNAKGIQQQSIAQKSGFTCPSR